MIIFLNAQSLQMLKTANMTLWKKNDWIEECYCEVLKKKISYKSLQTYKNTFKKKQWRQYTYFFRELSI